MIRNLIRLVGVGCFLFCAYQGYQHWMQKPEVARPADHHITTIIRGDSNGQETVLWRREK